MGIWGGFTSDFCVARLVKARISFNGEKGGGWFPGVVPCYAGVSLAWQGFILAFVPTSLARPVFSAQTSRCGLRELVHGMALL